MSGEVRAKSLENSHFRVVSVPRGSKVGPSWLGQVAGDGENEKDGSNGNGWMYTR